MIEYNLKKRLTAFLTVIALLFLLLFCRLTFLQIISSSDLQALALEQWTRGLAISSKRGTIYDRNGIVLAESKTSYNVYVRPASVKDINKVCVVLGDILGLEYSYIEDKCKNRSVSESLIKLQIDQKQAVKIYKANLGGVYLSENSTRYYPYGNFLSQVLGYTTIDNIGQSGIEMYYNKYLKGIDGKTLVNTDIRGREINNTLDMYMSGIPGCNLYLTIDYYLQCMAENAVRQIMENEKKKNATIIIMDPKSSEILAMASSPSFDLNNIPRNNPEELSSQSKCLSIVDVYEPGSTFKVLTTAMALEEKLTTPEERFYDPGYRIVDGEKIKCWKLVGHGSQTMTEGLCNSCNSVFLDLALRLGKDKLYDYFEKFNFGSKLGVDFAGESSGIIMNYDSAQKVDYARMGFGQAIAVTPLQMINALCSVVNGGNLYQPYFVKSITNPAGTTISSNTKSLIRRVVSEDTSQTIRGMMEQVIIKANGINTFIPGYRVSGKTGTSQKYSEGKINGLYTSSFAGAFPADNPDYMVLVIVDEPSGDSYYGSVVATPYAKQIFESIIAYKNYRPTESIEEEKKQMEKNIRLPDLTSMSMVDATQKLISLGLNYEVQGEGGTIINQLPKKDTMMFKNGIVVLITN